MTDITITIPENIQVSDIDQVLLERIRFIWLGIYNRKAKINNKNK